MREVLVAGAEGWGFARLFREGFLLFLGERTVLVRVFFFWCFGVSFWSVGFWRVLYVVSFGVQKGASSV